MLRWFLIRAKNVAQWQSAVTRRARVFGRQSVQHVLPPVIRGAFWPRLRRAVDNWFEDDGSMMAAATAYYAALSIFPILLLLIAILGYVLRFSQTAQGAKAQLLQLVADNTSPQVSNHVADTLSSVQTSASIGGPAGVAVLVVTAIAVFSQVDTAWIASGGSKARASPAWWPRSAV